MTSSEFPPAIGPVHFNPPRAVKLRDTTDVANKDKFHSAVNGTLNVWVDTKEQANSIIAAWPEIMSAVAKFAEEILDELKKIQESKAQENTQGAQNMEENITHIETSFDNG